MMMVMTMTTMMKSLHFLVSKGAEVSKRFNSLKVNIDVEMVMMMMMLFDDDDDDDDDDAL